MVKKVAEIAKVVPVKNTYYVVMKLQKWADILVGIKECGKSEEKRSIYFDEASGGMFAYLPVFRNKNEAVKYNNGSELNILEVTDA
jgi:L-rhamnose mutarotase